MNKVLAMELMLFMQPINNLTAFDVETPNSKNDSICSIGIHHVKSDGTIVDLKFIINPDDYFEDRNIGIHRINENMVENAPRFIDIWENISEYFQDSIIIAHNASFDLSVFYKTLYRYNLEVPDINYVCILQMARRYLNRNECNGYSLPSLCSYLGIQLDHHNSLSDAVACAHIYDMLTKKYGSDIKQYDKPAILSKEAAKLCRKALMTLRGILLGINFDCKLYPEELISFQYWVQDYGQYKGYPDIQICINKIDEVLADGLITYDEYNSLLKLTEIDEQNQLFSKTTEAIQQLMGIIEGISCDAKINDIEAHRLSDWLLKHDFLDGSYPFDKICSILYKMLDDGHIDPSEESDLLDVIDSILHPTEDFNELVEIAYEGSLFCLTGDFTHGSKNQIGIIIAERGGQVANSVSKKIQYLIVGALGSPKWAYGSFGEKVTKAQELNEKGARIKILKESDLFN